MNAKYYTEILEEHILPAVEDVFGDIWTLHQDNAPIHTAEHTTD